MPVATTSALYYPSIQIKDEPWLRSAVLFWDHLRTIVPESIRTPYTTDLAAELEAEGVLTPVRVDSGMPEIEELADAVLDTITDPTASAVLLASEAVRGRFLHPEKLPRPVRELVEIHPGKLPYIIRDHLERALNDQGWLEVSPGFANFYMTLLATKLAERLGLALVTDSPTADQLAIAAHKGKPLPTLGSEAEYERRMFGHYDARGRRRRLPNEAVPGLLVDLVLEAVEVPRNVEVADLLRFKRDHREELAVFRREMNRLAAEIPRDLPLEALRQAVNDQYEAQVRPAIKSLKQSLAAQRWEQGLNGFLKVSFFSAAPTSAALLAGVPSTVALVAGAGISVVASAVLLAEQRRKLREGSPYSYLLSLGRLSRAA